MPEEFYIEPTYDLEERQKLSFTDTCDIFILDELSHAPASIDSTGNILDVTLFMADVNYIAQPKYINVPCKHFQTDELAPTGILGQTNRDTPLVIDKYHFSADQPIEINWGIRLTTPGSPNAGLFWICQGNAKIRPTAGERRANNKKLFALRSPFPVGINGDGVAVYPGAGLPGNPAGILGQGAGDP